MPENVNDPDLQESAAVDNGASPATATVSDDPLAAVQQEKDALQDRLLRTVAEFDNFRKRIDRERRELAEFAASDVVMELLPIVDNFERALQTSAPPEAEPFRRGIEMIHRQMLDLLRKRGVRPIDVVGADFDPNFHQAIMHEASTDHREGEVMQELQRGYMLGDRLLRPAMVKVAKNS
jgi:molecular chaperone GrpE